jgi:hypothetical protein
MVVFCTVDRRLMVVAIMPHLTLFRQALGVLATRYYRNTNRLGV